MKKLFMFSIMGILLSNFIGYSQSNKNIIYLSPVPNSKMNSSSTNIIFRTKNILIPSTINSNLLVVKGSFSGLHVGFIKLSNDKRTIIYNPYEKFYAGELVTVDLKPGVKDIRGIEIGECKFNFLISKSSMNSYKIIKPFLLKEIESEINKNINNYDIKARSTIQKIYNSNSSLPNNFPQIFITNSSYPSSGYIFMASFDPTAFIPGGNGGSPYLLILDNTGKPFYYKKMRNFCIDFKLQPNGLITYFDSRVGYFYGMNNNFSIVDSFYCGNGYPTDFHELQILPNGDYLIIGQDYEKVDMSKIVSGGDTSAIVTGNIIQELDHSKNVVFQWRSWDHFKITDAAEDINLKDNIIDYVHANAIELDADTNYLISSRHLDEITKINRETGDIIWRLGGKNNQFQFINDSVGFSHQHDIRRLSNGDITLFDDGNLHWAEQSSRAVEYKLDEVNNTAELVWQFINSPDEYSAAMGNVQRLKNGNYIIGWGTGYPAVTEATPQDSKVFELSLSQNVWNYRAFRFDMDSSYYKPFVSVLDYPPNGDIIRDTVVNLQWNKNKFAQSFHLQISRDSTFENPIYNDSTLTDTTISFDSLTDGVKYFWRILSFNNTDSIGGFSSFSKYNTFSTLLKKPINLNVYSTTQANFITWNNITNNADSIIIERKGGCDTVDYKKIGEVSKGRGYFVDADPDTTNVISNEYSYRIKAVNSFSYSDYLYSLAFSWAGVTGIHSTGSLPKAYSLKQNYPNPFNPSTSIKYDIPKDSYVLIKIYNSLGQEEEILVNGFKKAGSYQINFNGNRLASGIYFYKLQAGNYFSVKKMILLK